MPLTPVNPPSLTPPRGYNHGMKGAGELLFVAGQVGWAREGHVVSADFVSQFQRALENVIDVVWAAGGKPSDIARMVVYVTDKSEYAARARTLLRLTDRVWALIADADGAPVGALLLNECAAIYAGGLFGGAPADVGFARGDRLDLVGVAAARRACQIRRDALGPCLGLLGTERGEQRAGQRLVIDVPRGADEQPSLPLGVSQAVVGQHLGRLHLRLVV